MAGDCPAGRCLAGREACGSVDIREGLRTIEPPGEMAAEFGPGDERTGFVGGACRIAGLSCAGTGGVERSHCRCRWRGSGHGWIRQLPCCSGIMEIAGAGGEPDGDGAGTIAFAAGGEIGWFDRRYEDGRIILLAGAGLWNFQMP